MTEIILQADADLDEALRIARDEKDTSPVRNLLARRLSDGEVEALLSRFLVGLGLTTDDRLQAVELVGRMLCRALVRLGNRPEHVRKVAISVPSAWRLGTFKARWDGRKE